MISYFVSTINASFSVINTCCNFRNFYRFPHWTGQVKGDLEVFEIGTTGEPSLIQKEVIFPAPEDASSQNINIPKHRIFGEPAGQRTGSLILNLDDLRVIAVEAMETDGYSPATE